MKRQAFVLPVALMTALSLVPTIHADGPIDPVAVRLRVAPVGFVVPSHWATCDPDCDAATWIVDPYEEPRFNWLPGVAACDLSVPDANADHRVDGGEALDQAVTDGCIDDWDYDSFAFGRFVTRVDGLDEAGWPVSWWLIQLNNYMSSVGIDDMNLTDGTSLDFVYEVGP